MWEKLTQAALITFLLHLITILNAGSQINPNSVSPVSEIRSPILGSTIPLFK